MFEASVDRFGRTACGVGMIEVGQDVPGSAFEGYRTLRVAGRVTFRRVGAGKSVF